MCYLNPVSAYFIHLLPLISSPSLSRQLGVVGAIDSYQGLLVIGSGIVWFGPDQGYKIGLSVCLAFSILFMFILILALHINVSLCVRVS